MALPTPSPSAGAGRGESEVAILEETGVSSGILEGSVRTILSIGERIPAALSVVEGETVRVTYVDQARANARQPSFPPSSRLRKISRPTDSAKMA